MRLINGGRGLRTALTAALCALFFVLAMGVTLLGSGVYRDTVAASEENDVRRTALSYLVNQVRRAQRVEVGSFESVPALDLADQDAPDYHTVLYVYEGQLRELYAEKGSGLTAADGIPILPLEGMELTLEEELLTIAVTAEAGGTSSVSISPRMGVGQALGGEVLG